LEFIRTEATKIMSIVEYLDSIYGHLDNLKVVRSGEYDYKDERALRVELDKHTDARYVAQARLKSDNINADAYDFISFYVNQREVDMMESIATSVGNEWPLRGVIVDLRDNSKFIGDIDDSGDGTEGLVSWYWDEIDEDTRKASGYESDRDIVDDTQDAYKMLGEVAYLGECGYLPYLLATDLSNKTRYSCNHMG
jgi:hypothetical protein